MELNAFGLLTRWRRVPGWLQAQTQVRQALRELPVALCQSDEALPRLLAQVETLPGVQQCVVRVGSDEHSLARRDLFRHCAQAAHCHWRQPDLAAGHGACGGCRARGVWRQVVRVPAADTQVLLETQYAPGRALLRLLDELAQSLGTAVQVLHHTRAQQHRMADVRQRTLARELHDSVAQQLGYLAFQAALLKGQLPQREQAEATLAELQGVLSQLQRQVRELITSARLSMNGRSLRQALADAVAEFSRRCIIAFELDNRLADGVLNPEAELQLLQIIREALTNAVRHSHARHVRIELREPREGGVSVSVEDDGIGLGPVTDLDNHFGLAIIRERAASIGASLVLERVVPQGTRVQLGLPRVHAPLSRRPADEHHPATAD